MLKLKKGYTKEQLAEIGFISSFGFYLAIEKTEHFHYGVSIDKETLEIGVFINNEVEPVDTVTAQEDDGWGKTINVEAVKLDELNEKRSINDIMQMPKAMEKLIKKDMVDLNAE